MSQPKFNRAEAIAQATKVLMETSPDILAEVLSQGAGNLSKEAQKALGKQLTAKVSKEDKEANRRAELAKEVKGWESECEAMKKMTTAQLAVYEPKFVKNFIQPREYIQRKGGKSILVKEGWNFGAKPGSVSRSGGTLDKREVDAKRYIFPNNKKGALSLGGTEYRFATQVCRALGISFNRDSAARVLASAAIEAKAGAKVLTVEYTPTDGESVSLLTRAKEAKKLGLLDARPEDK